MNTKISLNENMLETLFPKEIFIFDEIQSLKEFYNEKGLKVTSCKLLILLKGAGKKPSDEEAGLIGKLISWIGLSLTEVVIINLSAQPITFKEVLKYLQIENVIAFDVLPPEIGLQIGSTHSKALNFSNCTFIFTSSLYEIKKNESVKKYFFESVSKVFIRKDQ